MSDTGNGEPTVTRSQSISHASSVDGSGISGGPVGPAFNDAAAPPSPPTPPKLTPIFNAAAKPPFKGGGPKPAPRPPDGPAPGGSGGGGGSSPPPRPVPSPEAKQAFKEKLTKKFNEKSRGLDRDR